MGANNAYLQSQHLGMEQQQLNAQMQDDALRRQEMQQQMEQQQQRQAQQQQQPGQYLPAGSGGAGGNAMQQALAATVPYTDDGGNTIRVTPQQKIQLANLDSAGITDPDQLAAMKRQIIGQPNLVKTKLPDGGTTFLPPQQAALAGYRGQQLDLSQQRADQGQQRIQDSHDYRSARLEQFRADNDRKLETLNDAAVQKQVLAARSAVDSGVKASEEQLTTAQRTYADTLAAVKEAAIEHKDFDPFGPAKQDEPPALTSLRSRMLKSQGAVDAAAQIRDQRVKDQEAEHANETQLLANASSQKSTAASAPTMKPVTPDLAKQYLVKAGGDLVKAKALAAQDGYQ